ncbi:glutamate--tRNA ligase [Candidatus Sumerlaeota bacterium]|nr:glutamate--tRNA ligase [Candidatus Sumerlaeota bacterium]
MTTDLTPDCRFRFAPSPTGTLHVGGARTALFNWLLARRCGGAFILRIEDTDRERSTESSVKTILDGLSWLGLDWDEGPYFQSQRGDLYDSAIERLLQLGRAYRCFCSRDRLDELREKARGRGENFVYDGLCREIPEPEAAERSARGEEHAVRFRSEPGSITRFNDLIGGECEFENDRVGDFIIRRTDGSPIYHLTVVVDDHEMRITHVVRGNDHLSNTPRQLLVFKALDWEPPSYAHLPLIQGSDHARLSKRHGATSVMEFAREGFLPEAMFNFLSLLGWRLDGETELMSRETLIQQFSLGRVIRSAAIFDRKKLEWMNGAYLRQTPLDELVVLARDHFGKSGVPEEHLHDPKFKDIVAMEQERSRTLEEMRQRLAYFFETDIESYETKASKKQFLVDGAEDLLATLEKDLGGVEDFDIPSLEACLRNVAEREELSFGKIAQPLRLALTGRSASPGIFEVLAALGRKRSLERISRAREWIREQKASSSASEARA